MRLFFSSNEPTTPQKGGLPPTVPVWHCVPAVCFFAPLSFRLFLSHTRSRYASQRPLLQLPQLHTYVHGGDVERLGNALVELLDVGKVADLLGRRAVCQLAVENHVKLLRRDLRAARRRRDGAALLRHGGGCVKR